MGKKSPTATHTPDRGRKEPIDAAWKRRRVYELVAAGRTSDEAAVEIGVAKATVRRWTGWTGPPPLKLRGKPGTLQHFRAWSRLLRTEDGDPFRLERFQAKVLADYFAGARELVAMIPKGNGKSTLLGALALYHLEITPGGDHLRGRRRVHPPLPGAGGPLQPAARVPADPVAARRRIHPGAGRGRRHR